MKPLRPGDREGGGRVEAPENRTIDSSGHGAVLSTGPVSDSAPCSPTTPARCSPPSEARAQLHRWAGPLAIAAALAALMAWSAWQRWTFSPARRTRSGSTATFTRCSSRAARRRRAPPPGVAAGVLAARAVRGADRSDHRRQARRGGARCARRGAGVPRRAAARRLGRGRAGRGGAADAERGLVLPVDPSSSRTASGVTDRLTYL